MSLIINRLFNSVALAHMIVDVLNGTRNVLLAFLSKPLGLSNTSLGLISTLYAVISSLAQPIFGFIADRFGGRWVAAGGMAWMAVFFVLAVTIPGPIAIFFLILAGIGSGAFHPVGAVQATLAGRTQMAGRETTAASFFFLFGQSGWFLGPLLGGAVISWLGAPGLALLALALIPVTVYVAVQLKSALLEEKLVIPEGEKIPLRQRLLKLSVLALVLVSAFQAWAQSNVTTFLPKSLSDLGQPPAQYGLLTSLFMGGSAIGNVIGGNLADRYGKQRVVMVSLALATLPLLLMGIWEYSDWYYLLVPLSGLLTGAAFSVIVVLSQRIMPGGMGVATGLVLGFTFSAGALGALLSGMLADAVSLPATFTLAAGISLTAGVLAPLVKDHA